MAELKQSQIEEIVRQVLSNINNGSPAAESKGTLSYNSTEYNGRKLIGIYADMNEAIAAAQEGYIQPDDIRRLIAFRDNPSDESWMNR